MPFYVQCIVYTLAAFLGTLGFGVLFRARANTLLLGAALGGIGYLAYFLLLELAGIGQVGSALAGAALVGIGGEIFARLAKTPALIYTTMGVIPLVPGAGLYQMMLNIVEGNTQLALSGGIETLLIAVAIAVALGVSAAIFRTFSQYLQKKGQNGSNRAIHP